MQGKPYFITAIATPLQEDDTLHAAGLERLIDDQFQAGIDGLLIGGTMGAMQLLTAETYRGLVERSLEFARGRGELLVGAGDVSFARTQARIAFLNTLPVDGVVVLPPYFLSFSPEELRDYYLALAEESKAPLYLYDLPQITKVKLSLETVCELAEHPNIRGIKCSDEPTYARQLIDLVGDRLRVIMAAPLMLDVFLRQGIAEHLDGVFCLYPRPLVALGCAAQQQAWETVSSLQREMNGVVRLLRAYGVWQPFTALMNALGVPGRMKPRPHRQWDAAETEAFLQDAETQKVLRFLRGAEAPSFAVVAEGRVVC
ncbi:MAG TPA: dihydrodipicolinate synthase family protein [Chthonomonadaceae bacterium]|nr:dihydrodipicolinate synthase family protein [Chthonomonadaceae bacterium]